MKTRKCMYCKEVLSAEKKNWATFYACRKCAEAYAEAHPKLVSNIQKYVLLRKDAWKQTSKRLDDDVDLRKRTREKLRKQGYSEDEIDAAWEEMKK